MSRLFSVTALLLLIACLVSALISVHARGSVSEGIVGYKVSNAFVVLNCASDLAMQNAHKL
jgi:hypothetical protein